MVSCRGPFLLSCHLLYGGGGNALEGKPVPSIDSEFTDFMLRHGRTYKMESAEFEMRKARFRKATELVDVHNGQSGRSWRASINKFADRTSQELAALRGWKNSRRPKHSSASVGGTGTVSQLSTNVTVTELPKEHSWMNLTSVKEVRDQGVCGSCWAFAAATVLRAHSEIWMKDPRKFSVQQIVSCTQNPDECGGTGGCQGATAELAMDYVLKYGCKTEAEVPYAAEDSTCPHSLLQDNAHEPSEPHKHHSIGMVGWTKLPENKVNPVKLALVTKGPVAVSVSASYSWNQYGGGVLDDCPADAVIDHAVVLIGYGVSKSADVSLSTMIGLAESAGTKFWHLQNSWGEDWGENGYLRMLRREDHFEENKQCGTDNDPQIGSGCKAGPPEVRVCGMCGFLYDTVIPHFSDRRSLKVRKHSSFLQQRS